MTGNQLSDGEAIHFGNALRINSRLELLDLSENHIGDPGAIGIAGALGSNDVLKELNLGWNNIRAPGMSAIFTVLKVVAQTCVPEPLPRTKTTR